MSNQETKMTKELAKAVSGHFSGTPEELRKKLLAYADQFTTPAVIYYWNCEMRPCQTDYCSTEVIFR